MFPSAAQLYRKVSKTARGRRIDDGRQTAEDRRNKNGFGMVKTI
jgi:hypothetical protein